MIIIIKAANCEHLPDGRIRFTTNVEDLKEALSAHSPNILVDYLNESWKPGIARIDKNKRLETACPKREKGGTEWIK